jgi:hypothetical protein
MSKLTIQQVKALKSKAEQDIRLMVQARVTQFQKESDVMIKYIHLGFATHTAFGYEDEILIDRVELEVRL